MSLESKNPGTCADDDAGFGTVAWSSPSNASADDGSYATATIGSSNISHYLKVTNFGFAIPSGATIDGILVAVLKYADNGGGSPTVRDYKLILTYSGAYVYDDKADTASDWPGSEAPFSYGGASDLWGGSPTPALVNDSSFGVGLAVQANGSGMSPNVARVDSIQITIYYSIPIDEDVWQLVRVSRTMRTTRGRAAIFTPELPDDVDVNEDADSPALIHGRVWRTTTRGRATILGSELLAGGGSTSGDDDFQPTLIVGVRSRAWSRWSHGSTVFDAGLHTGQPACPCPPAGVELLGDGYRVDLVSVTDTGVPGGFLVELVATNEYQVELIDACDC